RGPRPAIRRNSQCNRIHIFTISNATPISMKRNASLGRGRARAHLFHQAVTALDTKPSSVALADTPHWCMHAQADVQAPGRTTSARAPPLVGTCNRDRNGQFTMLGATKGVGGGIAGPSLTQRASAALFATNGRGDNGWQAQ